MQQGSQPASKGPRRRETRRWVMWNGTFSAVLFAIVLAAVATYLATTLPAPAVGLVAGRAGAGEPTATAVPVAAAFETWDSVSPDVVDVAAAPAPMALAEGVAPNEDARLGSDSLASRSEDPAETSGGLPRAAGPVRSDIGEVTPTTQLDRDDLGQGARAMLASRGGIRQVEPSPQPTPQPTPAPRREVVTYRVVEGDTVSGLAQRFGISPQTIIKANDLQDPEHLAIGQELAILPVSGVRHTVQEGDTLLALAERYRVIPEDLVAVNGLADRDRLSVGQVLLVPEVPSEQLAASVAPEPGAKILKPTSYTVASGDTLFGIAARFGLAADTLRWANPDIANPDSLPVGQQLLVPPVDGMVHRVVAGDTVFGVAALHNASAAELVQANGLTEPYTLSLGQLLVVPGGRPLPSVSPSQPVAQATPTPTARPQPTARPTATPVPPKPAPAPAPAPAAKTGSAGDQIVAIAMKYRGYRYTWGGTSPSTGFDCSGFVWYVYRQAGVALSRDLWGQYNTGARISRDALQPGDIVFFQNTYQPGLSHDGIYIGGGQFIQAASERTGVIVTSLSEPYWAARYLGARRPY